MPHSDSEEDGSEYEFVEVEDSDSDELEDELVAEDEEVTSSEESEEDEEEEDEEEEEESEAEEGEISNDAEDLDQVLREHGEVFFEAWQKFCIILAELKAPLVPGVRAQEAFNEFFWEHVWNERADQQ